MAPHKDVVEDPHDADAQDDGLAKDKHQQSTVVEDNQQQGALIECNALFPPCANAMGLESEDTGVEIGSLGGGDRIDVRWCEASSGRLLAEWSDLQNCGRINCPSGRFFAKIFHLLLYPLDAHRMALGLWLHDNS